MAVIEDYGDIIRQKGVIDAYKQGVMSLGEVVDNYRRWRDLHEGILLYEHDFTANTGQYIGIQARKRGNKVHEYWVESRLRPILDFANRSDIDMFKDDDPSVKEGGKGSILHSETSRAWSSWLFLTLEYDHNIYSVNDSWLVVSNDLNRFFARLRRQYGKISYLRTYETHASGVAHVHLIIHFKESRFRVFKYNGRYRVDVAPLLKLMWSREGEKLGFVDVQAVRNIRAGVKYIVKYIVKRNTALENLSEGDRNSASFNFAVQWLFDKRAFSVSGDFAVVLQSWRRDSAKHNSNMPVAVTSADGEKIYRKSVIDDNKVVTFHWLRYFYVGSLLWHDLIACSKFSERNSPFIIGGLDLSKLSIPARERIEYSLIEIDLMVKDVAVLRRSVKYPDLFVCSACMEYHGNRIQVRLHQSLCRIILERRNLQEYHPSAFDRELFGFVSE